MRASGKPVEEQDVGAATTQEIAQFVCDTEFRHLPSDVVEYGKVLALSHLGMNIAGSSMDVGRTAIAYAKSRAADSEAGVFGAGFRTTTDYAALANGASAHATELEDVSFPEIMYSCGHWPAVFAVAEKLRRSGKELMVALVVGYEAAAQLGLAFLPALRTGRAPYPALGTIGNAAAASKLMGLSIAQTTNALSLAASQAAGLRRQTGSGAHVIEAGFAGRNGVCAAELASVGYTGTPTILEGRDGFGDTWSDCPEFDLPLGVDYRLMHVSIKKYSCWFVTHRNIDALLDLIAEHGLKWDDVERIEHGINRTVAASFADIQQPESEDEARFSFAHHTVACFLEGGVFLPSFSMERVLDPRWKEARKKVKVVVHPDLPLGTYETYDSPLSIHMKDGRVFNRTCRRATGSPDFKRFGPHDVMSKYLSCVEYAQTFSESRAAEIADTTLRMDRVDDISDLSALLTFPDRLERKASPGDARA